MRKLILRTMLILPLLAVLIYAMQSLASQPFGESFGYSSEDFVDGGSYLGVDTRDVTADRLAALKLKEEHGVEVTMVDQDAPARKAGLNRDGAFRHPQRPDGGKPHSPTGRFLRRQERPRGSGALGGEGEPRRESRISGG